MKESIQKTEQPARTIQSSGRNQGKEFVDNRTAFVEKSIQLQPPKFSLSPLKIPKIKSKDELRAEYSTKEFASNLATATNWGKRIGCTNWAVKGSLAVALHSLETEEISGKVVSIDDLDILDENAANSLLTAKDMPEYYEVPNCNASRYGNYVADKVLKTCIDILPPGDRFGSLENTVLIYGLPVESISSLKKRYIPQNRKKTVLKLRY